RHAWRRGEIDRLPYAEDIAGDAKMPGPRSIDVDLLDDDAAQRRELFPGDDERRERPRHLQIVRRPLELAALRIRATREALELGPRSFDGVLDGFEQRGEIRFVRQRDGGHALVLRQLGAVGEEVEQFGLALTQVREGVLPYARRRLVQPLARDQ